MWCRGSEDNDSQQKPGTTTPGQHRYMSSHHIVAVFGSIPLGYDDLTADQTAPVSPLGPSAAGVPPRCPTLRLPKVKRQGVSLARARSLTAHDLVVQDQSPWCVNLLPVLSHLSGPFSTNSNRCSPPRLLNSYCLQQETMRCSLPSSGYLHAYVPYITLLCKTRSCPHPGYPCIRTRRPTSLTHVRLLLTYCSQRGYEAKMPTQHALSTSLSLVIPPPAMYFPIVQQSSDGCNPITPRALALLVRCPRV